MGATVDEGAGDGLVMGGASGGAGIAGTVLGDNIDSIPRGDDMGLATCGAGAGAGIDTDGGGAGA
jgi:hypothetical protein